MQRNQNVDESQSQVGSQIDDFDEQPVVSNMPTMVDQAIEYRAPIPRDLNSGPPPNQEVNQKTVVAQPNQGFIQQIQAPMQQVAVQPRQESQDGNHVQLQATLVFTVPVQRNSNALNAQDFQEPMERVVRIENIDNDGDNPRGVIVIEASEDEKRDLAVDLKRNEILKKKRRLQIRYLFQLLGSVMFLLFVFLVLGIGAYEYSDDNGKNKVIYYIALSANILGYFAGIVGALFGIAGAIAAGCNDCDLYSMCCSTIFTVSLVVFFLAYSLPHLMYIITVFLDYEGSVVPFFGVVSILCFFCSCIPCCCCGINSVRGKIQSIRYDKKLREMGRGGVEGEGEDDGKNGENGSTDEEDGEEERLDSDEDEADRRYTIQENIGAEDFGGRDNTNADFQNINPNEDSAM